MRIGDFEINGGAALAPMAGVADRAFREICIEFGAAYVVTEMVSSKGLTMHDKKSGLLMQLGESERPAAVQIFGCVLMFAAVVVSQLPGKKRIAGR